MLPQITVTSLHPMCTVKRGIVSRLSIDISATVHGLR